MGCTKKGLSSCGRVVNPPCVITGPSCGVVAVARAALWPRVPWRGHMVLYVARSLSRQHGDSVEAQKVPENYIKATVSSTVRERLRTLIQQIKSRTRLEQIIEELHLVDDLHDQKAMNTYVKKMLRHIDVEVKGPDAFTVSYMGEDPYNVMLVTNKLASLFIEENLKAREQQVIGTTEFLDRSSSGCGRCWSNRSKPLVAISCITLMSYPDARRSIAHA